MTDTLSTLARLLDRDARRRGLVVQIGPCAERAAALVIRRSDPEAAPRATLQLWPHDPARPAALRGVALDGRLTWTGSPDPAIASWVAAVAPAALGAGSVALARALDSGAYDPRSILDVGVETLVARGLKPAARLSVASGADISRLAGRVPVVLPSTDAFSFTREGRIDASGDARRFVYLATEEAVAERLRAIDEILFSLRGPLHDPARSRALRREQGTLLGYPPCCVSWFADDRPATPPGDELWDLVAALGWDGLGVDPRLNFLASVLYKTPIVPHVPCGAACAETAARTVAWLRALYSPYCARVVASFLEVCAVLWQDGRLVPFLLDGADGPALRVRSFNRPPHPALMTEAWRLRRVPETPEDPRVRSLRVEGDALLIDAGAGWLPWPSAPPGRPTLLLFAPPSL